MTVAALAFGSAANAQPRPNASCSNSAPLSIAAAPVSLRSSGATVGVIDSAALAPFFGRTLSQALTAHLPGVSVMRSSGVAGTGSRIWLRGPSGILMTQQPLLFIDGIRADGEMQSIIFGIGGQAPSRLDDIPIEDVECIYVLRGPATTAQYGTDAAGGVIHVITRKASAESARVETFFEGGTTQDVGDYPANFGNATSCTRVRSALGLCATSPVRSWSPLEADSPFRTATLLHGGGRAAIVANEHAALGVSGSGTLDDGAFRNNEHRQYAAGLTGGVHSDSTFGMQGDLWLMGGRADLPYVGNPMVSILNSALLGSSVDDPVHRGYRGAPLSVLEEFGTEQHLRRLGGVVHVDWKPKQWLSVGALAGREDSRVRDQPLPPPPPSSQFPPEPRTTSSPPAVDDATPELRAQRTSAAMSATATYGSTARFTSEVSASYLSETNRQVTSTSSSYSWRAFDGKTKGVVVRQTLAWHDRRFFDAGLRHDLLDRAFVKLENPTYPFASAAWDLGREPFFPTGRVLSSLRIRGAYGESGDSRPYIAAFDLALTVPAGTPVKISPPPVERTRELEGGVDVGLFSERVMVDATLFTKRTSDGLVQALVPPGVGTGVFQTVINAGAWSNRGAELALRAKIVDGGFVRTDLAVTFTALKNEVTSLGNTPPLIGTYFSIVPGYPLYGAWGRRFTVTDANKDGVIVPAEVVADTATQYLGSPVPTRELGVAPSFVFGRAVTVAALVDYRGGFRAVNSGGRLRCNVVCADLYLPTESMVEQARAVDPDASAAWVEDASFVRLRELSVAWTMPAAWSKHVGARSASLVLAGRNLFTSTSYTGLDPEGALTGQTRIDQQDLFTLPPPRTVSLRLDVGW